MKMLQWIARWFVQAKKSLGSLGVGLRAALSGGTPGGWASDHREETAHNTGFNYIAIHAIAAQVAGATVTVFSDGDEQAQRRTRRKSLATRAGTFARWKSLYGADDRETDPLPPSHPLIRLLRRPNPYESGANFRYRQAQQIRLTGTCLIWNVPSVSGRTCERYVIPTSMATPVPPTIDLPRGGWQVNPVASRYTPVVDDGYVECPSWYRILGQIVDARQVQIIRLPHAWYLDDGQSPLSAGAKWVDAGEAVDQARFHQLKNGVDPSVVWNLPPDVSPDQDEIDRVQAKISAKYGGPENVGRVMVAQSGTTITPLSATPKDMCYTEAFHDFKAAILALHQTPPVAVGLQEPGAYAAYNASMKAWRHAAVQPLCDMLAESDTEYLAPQFGDGLTIEIESDTVDDTQLIEQQLQNDLAAKVRTKNEWRAVRGMPALPGDLGNALVGTDANLSPSNSERSHVDGPSQPAVNRDHSFIDSAQPEPNDSNSQPVPQPSNGESSIGKKNWTDDLARCLSYSEQALKNQQNRVLGSLRFDPSAEDIARARIIFELLFGLSDASENRSGKIDRDTQDKAFNPNEARDAKGKWTKVATPEEVSAATNVVRRILRGEVNVASPRGVSQHLSNLSTEQLHSVQLEEGVDAPPNTRRHLRRSILGRLGLPYLYGARSFAPPAKTNAVKVNIQHADEVHRRTNVAGLNGGQPLTPEQWGQLVGAQPGARVDVFPRGWSQVEIIVDHPHYHSRRILDGSGEIENNILRVAPSQQRQGLGARMLATQVEAATQLGVKKIRASALGTGVGIQHDEEEVHLQGPLRSNGYYTWARLGFDGKIEPQMKIRRNHDSTELQAVAADFDRRFPKVTHVSQMMKTKKRRAWWKQYGGYFDGEFDLSPGSTSRRILAKYLAEKESQNQSKALVSSVLDTSVGQAREGGEFGGFTTDNFADASDPVADSLIDDKYSDCEEPDTLSQEDEELLDRVWDQFGTEVVPS